VLRGITPVNLGIGDAVEVADEQEDLTRNLENFCELNKA
jgi:hypothetical protein